MLFKNILVLIGVVGPLRIHPSIALANGRFTPANIQAVPEIKGTSAPKTVGPDYSSQLASTPEDKRRATDRPVSKRRTNQRVIQNIYT